METALQMIASILIVTLWIVVVILIGVIRALNKEVNRLNEDVEELQTVVEKHGARLLKQELLAQRDTPVWVSPEKPWLVQSQSATSDFWKTLSYEFSEDVAVRIAETFWKEDSSNSKYRVVREGAK